MAVQQPGSLPGEKIQDMAGKSNLTNSQFLIWLGQTMSPSVPLYNMILTFRFDAPLNVEIFQAAFQALVYSSDALRIVIEEVDGVPQQRVLEPFSFTFERVDLSGTSDPEAAYRTWLEDRRTRIHDLSACLFDTALVQLSPACFVWYLNQHHLITDGWSIALLYRRMKKFYEQLLLGNQIVQDHLPAYMDYVLHERVFRATPSFEKAESYWAKKVSVPVEPLTFYEKEPGKPSHRTERVLCDLGAVRTARLKRIAAEKGIRALNPELSLYNLFLTLFTAYLHRISGNRSILLGSPFHNRPTLDFKETIGVFIEVCPLRLEIDSDESFSTLHKKVMRETMNALLNARPGTSTAEHNRSYNVLLNFVNVAFPPFAGMQPQVDWVHSDSGDRDHALRLQIHDFNATGSYKLLFDFSAQVFTAEHKELAIQHFLRVVDAFLEDRDQPVHRVSLLSPAERSLLLDSFNQTTAEYPSNETIIDLFEQQVRLTPGSPAVRLGERSYSYSELDQRADRLAHELCEQGVHPGSLVAISMDHSLEVVVAILGVLRAGGAYVPIDPDDPLERIESILEDLGHSTVLLTQPQYCEKFTGLNVRLVLLDDSLEGDPSETGKDPLPSADPDDLAYVIYTSGSTGRPKGVMVRHRSLVNYIWWARGHYLKGEVWDFPLFSSLSFDLTVTSIFTPLITGGQIVVYPDDPDTRGMAVLKVFEENAVDIVKLTPAHLALLRHMDFSRSRIKALILGGEDLKTELAGAVSASFDHQVAIYNEYGPTEATVGCMIHRFDPSSDTNISVPIGRPIHNARIYVLDNNLQPVSPGMIGEICIGGAGVARGYLRRPELTEARFVENPSEPGSILYRTGDLGRWSSDGRLQFLGRSDHQVKVKGYRIELGEIESHLLEHPVIQSVVVTAFQPQIKQADQVKQRCVLCGLPDNYPGVSFDQAGVCNTCRDFSELKERFRSYFKSPEDLKEVVAQAKQAKGGKYDSMVLYSGGKDSTYMLYQLVRVFGMQPLVFSLDNGYISEEAKANIRRVTDALGVDLVFGQTPHMKAVFADSLRRHSNVCDGCFKVIYTLSISLARKEGIKYIFTGLSRGQLFETRLSDMFQARIFDADEIDRTVLAARRAYHRVDDAVRQLLDVEIFEQDRLFEEIQLVDFYRYTDVPLAEMYRYLDQNAPWIRPSDTGRSTNCLINDAGIYIHKKERGFHNYALPYSWDVRVGHKTTDETIHELNDEIDMNRVRSMLAEVGYDENEKIARRADKRLVAYFVSSGEVSASDLREYLSARLPEYMIPADFIHLEEMPLTTNGKVDRAALPDPDQARSARQTSQAAPTNERERRLAEIWGTVFRLPEIGIHDNFFELGGDSIISIQIVTKARQAGLHFTPRDLFEKQTVAELATIVRAEQNVSAEQGLVTGAAPLIPIQHWFFEQGFTQPHYWNQSVWLEVPASVDPKSLEQALNFLPGQHDMLRTRFNRTEMGIWQQSISADIPSLPLEFHDISGLNAGERETFIKDRANELAGSLDLERGPLLKAALFTLDADQPKRLFITCHHLVVDGVSWQPLLEDWETAYRQLRQRQAVHLPFKTTSFKEWAEKLIEYAQSPALDHELEYWSSSLAADENMSSTDTGADSGSAGRVYSVLSEKSTNSLLQEVHETYNTSVLDLLLAAWARAYGDHFDSDLASVMVEGHGRETEIFEDVDLSHTVGWFTIHYPVEIGLQKDQDPAGLLKKVKELLRRVPGKGLGYGLLRYLRADKDLASQPVPPVLFNYLGQFERALPASELFTVVQPLQAGYGPQNRRPHAFDVNASIRGGQLQVEIVYGTGQFTAAAMQSLADSFMDRLEELIAHCLSPNAGGHTPSDFALADLNDEQFNRLSNILDQLDGE